MTETATPRLHNIKQTAKALGITTRTVNRLVSRSEIPSVKIGARRLFDLHEVIEALKCRNAFRNTFD
jgi:excisionase family DNA binding protein